MADQEDLKAELDRLKAENEQLKSRYTRGVSLKVSEKGGVSVYGLGRFPVTLYREQWVRLLERTDDLKAFMEEHAGELKNKGEEGEKAAEPEAAQATEPATTVDDAGASYPPSNE